MNNTKTSHFTSLSRRPESMRVVLKQRNNCRQPGQNVNNSSSYPEKVVNEHIDHISSNRKSNVTDIKTYVKNRMKTDYCDNFKIDNRPLSSDKASPIQQQKHNLTASSIQKNRTISGCKSLNTSTHGLRTISADDRKLSVNRMKLKGLESLQQKIEGLLEQRMRQCQTHKKQRSEGVEVELKKIIDQLIKFKREDPLEQQSQQNLQILDKKIGLFEKLIAENMVESDIMKKFYLSKLTNKTKHRRIKTQTAVARQINIRQPSPTPQPVIVSSTSRDSFKRPQRKAYNIYRYQNQFFNADRHKQPLPRSSYNREFLIYGVGMESAVIPQDHQFMKTFTSIQDFGSSYKAQFAAKRAQRINIQELDACRDKFKNLPVMFGRKEKQSLHNGYQQQLGSRISKMGRYQTKPQLPQFMMSESRRSYNRQSPNIPSSIKNQNLQKLKYQYKQKLHV